jgi:MFS family permease
MLRDRPSDKGQTPDGIPVDPKFMPPPARSLRDLFSQPVFWLLLLGSFSSIGAIGAINFHMKLAFKDQGFVDQSTLNAVWRTASVGTLWSSIAGRLLIGKLADMFPMKWVMLVTYFVVAGSIPLLRMVHPSDESMVYVFAIVFGFAMGADYMLIPLMAAKQFGVNSLARSMAVLLPINTIGQTWVPQGVSMLRDHYGNYAIAMMAVLALAVVGAIAVALLPKQGAEDRVAAPQAMRA